MFPQQIPPSSKEAEERLLGCLLVGGSYVEEAVGTITPEMFYHPGHAAIMKAIAEVHAAGTIVDITTVTNAMRRKGADSMIGLKLMELTEPIVNDINAPSYAQIVIQKYINREAIRRAAELQEAAYSDDLDSVIAQSAELGDSLLSNIPTVNAEDIKSILSSSIKEMDQRNADRGKTQYIDCRIHAIDTVIGGLDPGSLVVIAGRPSMGKAQPLDSKILTSTGWTTMGELFIGQELASIDGKESIVTGLYPQGEQQIYQITFSDGRTVECTKDHLWTIMYRDWDAPRTVTTECVIEMLQRKRYRGRLWIDTPSGDYGRDNDIELDPWVLGVLIGNGCLTKGTPMISTGSAEILQQLSERLLFPHVLNKQDSNPYDYRIVATEKINQKNPLIESLKILGLKDKHSYEKFIPKQYLTASRETRLQLLSGLMDTDGYVDAAGNMSYCTSSKQLADDVAELVRSLGGWCTITTKVPFYTYRGERHQGRLSYNCRMANMREENICTVPFKRDRMRGVNTVKRLTFSSIIPSRVAEAQCITVSHPSQLYITNNYVVTHNTAISLQLAYNISSFFPVLFFTLEMTKAEIGNRYLTMLTDIDTIRLKRGDNFTSDEWRLLERATADMENRTLIIDDSATLSIYNMRSKIYRMVRNKGIKIVFIDYLQLMEGAKGKEGAEYYGTISRTCKQIAKELKIVVVLLSQLNREVEKRGEKIPRLHDLRASGEIEQDADIVMFPVRCDRAGIDDPSKGLGPGKAIISIAKNRNGRTDNVVINVTSNAARWWDDNDIFAGPSTPVSPHYLDDIEQANF